MAPDQRPTKFLFLHVMKTGGSSMLRRLLDNFAEGEVEPDVRVSMKSGQGPTPPSYGSIDRLRALTPERHEQIRVYCGHYPYMVTELLDVDVVLTVLRDPVERTVSFLRHVKRYQPAKRDLSLEEIYDGPWDFPLLIHDYQSKLFAMRFGEEGIPDDKAHIAHYPMDDERLARAKETLEQVDVLGLQERYGDFLAELTARFGWRFPEEYHARKATEPWHPTPALLERIAADNAIDIEFYRHAVALHDRRRRAA